MPVETEAKTAHMRSVRQRSYSICRIFCRTKKTGAVTTGTASGTIADCTFYGTITAAKNLDKEQAGQAYIGGITGDFSSVVSTDGESEEDKEFQGIVGRIGEAVLLSVDADTNDPEQINRKDALVMISNCTSSGALKYEEPQKGEGVTEEEFEKAKEEKWKVSMGGILGDCSARDGYSVRFENCTYDAARGLGNTALPDIE